MDNLHLPIDFHMGDETVGTGMEDSGDDIGIMNGNHLFLDISIAESICEKKTCYFEWDVL